MGFGRGALLWLLGIPLPIILLLALFGDSHHPRRQPLRDLKKPRSDVHRGFFLFSAVGTEFKMTYESYFWCPSA